MIGWCYLAGALLFLASRGDRTVLAGAVGLMTALYIGSRHGVLDFLGPVNGFIDVGSLFGSHAAVVTAGMLAGTLFLPGTEEAGPRVRIRSLAILGSALLLAGFVLRPLHGFSKIRGTESYALATAGVCCLVFLLFYARPRRLQRKEGGEFPHPRRQEPAPGLSPAGVRRQRRGTHRGIAIHRPRTDPLAVLRDGRPRGHAQRRRDDGRRPSSDGGPHPGRAGLEALTRGPPRTTSRSNPAGTRRGSLRGRRGRRSSGSRRRRGRRRGPTTGRSNRGRCRRRV